jgi:hypothetical protein
MGECSPVADKWATVPDNPSCLSWKMVAVVCPDGLWLLLMHRQRNPAPTVPYSFYLFVKLRSCFLIQTKFCDCLY